MAEQLGIPSVTVAATSFLSLVQLVGAEEGVPHQKYAEYPGTLSVESEETIKKGIENKTLDQIVRALTEPLEDSAIDSTRENAAGKIILQGNLQKITESFHVNDLTDGIAIAPPTMERVDEFLRYTDRSPDEEIAVLPPANLRATPLVIAANGVMAGCRPEHMPILISAVEAIADPIYNLEQIGTTGGLNQFLLINGPIVKELGIKADIGLVSRSPNVAIGRAFGLILRNIAGLRPGEQYMGTFGYVLPFVLAEHEDESPWDAFHVQHGFSKGTSTVTAGGTFNWGGQVFPSGTDPEGLLRIICSEIVRHVNLMTMCQFGHLQMMTVLITPSVAKVISDSGYSKQDVRRYFFENSRITIEELSFELKHGWGTGPGISLSGVIEEQWDMPEEWATLRPEDTVPAMAYPETIHVVVCGDVTRNKAMTLHGVYNRPSTKEICVPADWNDLICQDMCNIG